MYIFGERCVWLFHELLHSEAGCWWSKPYADILKGITAAVNLSVLAILCLEMYMPHCLPPGSLCLFTLLLWYSLSFHGADIGRCSSCSQNILSQTFQNVHGSMCIKCVCVLMGVSMPAPVCLCGHLCVYDPVDVSVCVWQHLCVPINVNSHTCVCTSICVYLWMWAHTYT